MNNDKPFEGLLVIELASVLAGPLVGTFFSELGARVIKVENKKGGVGDVTRSWKLPTEPIEQKYSAYYCSANYCKESLFMDLSLKDDKEALNELLQKADIVISNYRKLTAQKLGVSYEEVKKVNEKIIFANINGYGADSNRPAYDVVVQAETGFMYMNGAANSPPTKMPVALMDVLAAHQLKEGILVALLKKERTGQGSSVSVSLFDAGIASLANQATNYLIADTIPQRIGSQHPNIAPYGDLFYTSDNLPIVLAIGSDVHFNKMCSILEITSDKIKNVFDSNTKRIKNRGKLVDMLKSAIKKWKRAILIQRLEQEGVPAGAVLNMEEVFEQAGVGEELVLKEQMPDGKLVKKVKTVVFKMT